MHVISRKKIRVFCEDHPSDEEAAEPLETWYRIAKSAEWKNFGELRSVYSRCADKVGSYIIFDIGGNKYRIVTEIFFQDQVILIRGVYTHREYDRLDFQE